MGTKRGIQINGTTGGFMKFCKALSYGQVGKT